MRWMTAPDVPPDLPRPLSAPIDLVPDEQTQIEADIAAISRIDVVPRLLRIICSNTGMGFAAVARVSDRT